jgi:hypothetical protein
MTSKSKGTSKCRQKAFVASSAGLVSGLQSPHGLAFVKTSDDDDSLREQIKDVCQTLLSEN